MTRALALALQVAALVLVLEPTIARADGPPAVVAPERGVDLTPPREGSTHRRRHRRHRRPGPPEAPYVIAGPHVEVGYGHYWLPIAHAPGDVNVGTLSGFLATGAVRAGATIEGGSRNYHLGNDDTLARGQIFAGWQGLHVAPPFVPWVTANLGLGVVIGQRFSTALAWVSWSLGVEAGADIYVSRGFHLGVAIGIAYYAVGEISYPVVDLRAYFGL